MKIAILGSGSKGNAMVLQSNNTTILIDAGLSSKQITLRLESLGLRPSDIDAVLLTHEHSDHVEGLRDFLKNHQTPVYTNARTKEYLQGKHSKIMWEIFQDELNFSINDLDIRAFPVPHDAQSPVGYTIQSEQHKFGLLTDTGSATKSILSALRCVNSLFIEANYDELLLEQDSKYSWSTKQRITSKHGHLSNKQAAEVVADLAHEKLAHVILGHLNPECNSEQHALDSVHEYFRTRANSELKNIICAKQDTCTGWIELE